ncbi:MAG TPA: type I glyceraldehyde-3-phosphate dehydrogenase [Candidatus Hydrothermia bacterium]|nr:type I glyceraldehyde-3-phosphate dehydrogenase [Candidatus Hydrothermae bacterium]MDD3649244.1 type I glyceraldehyde-3-phosphate dehydrogenase [Candidatus Hydrothermia bacterium]HOK22659.1 type I glyceraldehyde-3-phosphate dehydrogenase [Candidatus Hydrothermia bacterium]HOL23368.1 type I glyceraldehyde-3-phosphate dehydrogenase [Candidatus Hydrothermia bacterium]HPO78449.1 type I glyceraldehyde-3-phosphate dehydrogenase [Candidatus Hydrothermia bacterium]
MGAKVGINGFGRIGRQILKIGFERKDIEFVAVNDLADPETLAILLKYDSVFGRYPKEVRVEGDYLIVDSKKIRVFKEKDPANIPWHELGTEIVVESTGLFTSKDKAGVHLKGSVKKVILSAPAKGEIDATIVMGVNENIYDPARHHIISNASCTTNAFAHIVKVLHDNFRIKRGVMTTVHAYTNDQKILDQPHKDVRRARAAALSIIPTSTGAAKTIFEIYPELQGKIKAHALRVPVSDVSIVDFACEVDKPTSLESVNEAFKKAQSKYVMYCEEPLVSIDFVGDTHSVIFDASLTQVVDDTLVKVYGWYDNEWGYSTRLVDLVEFVAQKL